MDELQKYISDQQEWSEKTFGTGMRTLGITSHIEKELSEIRAKPDDLEEWIDVIILAIDGYWRAGGKSEELMKRMNDKQAKNFSRTYPFPVSQDVPSEHIRLADIALHEADLSDDNMFGLDH